MEIATRHRVVWKKHSKDIERKSVFFATRDVAEMRAENIIQDGFIVVRFETKKKVV